VKTIEDKLHIAHELGRIAGAAECIEDEGTRDTIYGAAESLFDGLLTEAGEDLRTDAAYWKQKYEDAIEFNKPRLVRSTSDYPPDPFDFVETGEMVEKEPKKETNFDRLTKSPEVLGYALATNAHECPREKCPYDDRHDPSEDACVRCFTDWLNEEAKEE